MPDLDPQDDQRLVAVSTGTDLEKDRALCGFLGQYPQIQTVSPHVFDELDKLSGAMSASEEASTPVALNLLQAVIIFDGDFQATCAQVKKVLGQPANTVPAPGLTVGQARQRGRAGSIQIPSIEV